MNKSVKKGVAIALSFATALSLSGAALFVPLTAQAALTQSQIDSIIALLQSFGADATTIANVRTSLTGGTPTVPPGGAGAACSFTRDLTMGAKGDDVKCLQQHLNGAGYKIAESGTGSPGNESTYFGSLTQSALAKWQAANGVTPSVGYFGPKSKAKYDSLVVGVTPPPGGGTPPPPPPGVVIPAEGITITLASDNPGSQVVPKGASGVTVLKFNVAGTGTLADLTFKREGVGATGDFRSSGVYIYEGNARLTSGKTINSTTHEISFPSLNIKLESQAKTLSLVVDVAAGATAANRNMFKLISATGSPTPTGQVTSNEVEIGGQIVGGLDPTSGADPANPRIGQKEALLQEFTLTASSTEDVELKRISLTETGTTANNNLSNFVLKQADKVLAKADKVDAKDLITFVLDTPFTIDKGQGKLFSVYGDISGSARADDTIILRFDQSSDIYATGKTYGYPVLPTISALDADSEADSVSIQGGQVTISFNGPIAGDVPLRGQDVTIFDFTIASQNNIEIKNLRYVATTTGNNGGNEGFNDFKTWDIAKNAVVTGAVDITATSTNSTFTDTITIAAGESRRFKFTVDIDADLDASDSIQVGLAAFQLGDIKNLDNNQNVVLADISPNGQTGNTQTVQAPSLDLGLAGAPGSQTYVRGSQNKPLVGVNLRAVNDKIKITTLKFTSSPVTGTLGSAEVSAYALYEQGATSPISSSYTQSGTAAPYTITFSNLSYTIDKGASKVLELHGSIDSNADNTDVYAFYVATAGSADVTAQDSEGNAPSITGVAANSAGSVRITVANVGDITVVETPGADSDAESEAGLVLAGTEAVLGKFDFNTTNEDMTVKSLHILVSTSSGATATTSPIDASDLNGVLTANDDIPTIKLYDGTTQIGNAAGYSVLSSGASSGIAIIEGLNWIVPKGSPKTLSVKGVVAGMSTCTATGCEGADTGQSVYVSIMSSGFEAQGSTASDKTITAATGNEKIVYRTKPILSVATQGSYKLTSGSPIPVFKFRVSADAKGAVTWRKVQFKVTMTGATMSAATTTSGSETIKIKDLQTTNYLTIPFVMSTSSLTATGSTNTRNTIVPGTAGYVSAVLGVDGDTISAGGHKEYELELQFSDLSTTAGASYVSVGLYRDETTKTAATTYDGVEGSSTDAGSSQQPSFIWSDRSANSHASSTYDWANARYLKTFFEYKTVSN